MPTAVPILCVLQRPLRIRNLITKAVDIRRVGPSPSRSSFSLPFHYSSLSFASPPFPLPLEVDPLNTAKGSGERCKLAGGVWGEAPAQIESGAFSPENLTSGGTKFAFLCGSFYIRGNWCIVLNFIATVG